MYSNCSSRPKIHAKFRPDKSPNTDVRMWLKEPPTLADNWRGRVGFKGATLARVTWLQCMDAHQRTTEDKLGSEGLNIYDRLHEKEHMYGRG